MDQKTIKERLQAGIREAIQQTCEGADKNPTETWLDTVMEQFEIQISTITKHISALPEKSPREKKNLDLPIFPINMDHGAKDFVGS